MTYRVVQWSTGNVGRHAIAGIDARPELELVGVWVSNPDKVGVDAGDPRRPRPRARRRRHRRRRGAAGPASPTASSTPRGPTPGCSRRCADLERFLRAGVNVVSSSPVFLQHPEGVVGEEMYRGVEAAAEEGGVSLWVNGIDPGFANDWLPLVMTSVCERIDEVRCMEILNYATYDQPDGAVRHHGLRPVARRGAVHPARPASSPRRGAASSRQLAAGLDVDARRDRRVARAGAGARGVRRRVRARSRRARRRRCASRCAAWSAATAKVVLEHVTRLRDDLAPDWPQPTGHGGYRVVITRRAQLHGRHADGGRRRRPQHRRPQGDGHAAGQRGPRRGRGPARACSPPSTCRSSPAGGW